MGMDHDDISAAMANVLQNIINTLTDVETIKKAREAHDEKRTKQPELKLPPHPFVSEKIGKCQSLLFAESIMNIIDP